MFDQGGATRTAMDEGDRSALLVLISALDVDLWDNSSRLLIEATTLSSYSCDKVCRVSIHAARTCGTLQRGQRVRAL
jgi:hypothetical protein